MPNIGAQPADARSPKPLPQSPSVNLRPPFPTSRNPTFKTQPPSSVPRQIGPYRIEALLGRGGMSTVYLAMQTTLDRRVALKLLPLEFAGDQTLVARFLQEARAAAALQHPHIIPVYDSGQSNGRYYIAMRYVDGVPLARAIPEAGLPIQRALHIVEQVASALDYAHSRGVIHRDVSAGNVMLEAGDHVTLMDFGIAQARQNSRLTRAGVAVGTLEYLSPEQARGETATAQADVYALGVLTYELLTGKLPFSGADDRALLLQHLNAPPPSARLLRSDLPTGVDAAIQRALAKDRKERFASAGAFAAALNATLLESRRRTVTAVPPVTNAAAAPRQGTIAPSTPAAKKPQSPAAGPAQLHLIRRRRLPRWAIAVLLLALLAVGAGAYGQRFAGVSATALGTVRRTSSVTRTTVTTVTTVRVTPNGALPPTAVPTQPAPTATATPPPVHPASPQAAVQGFFSALNSALANGHNTGRMALAYAYLSPAAQSRLSFPAFQAQYAADTGLAWQWTVPTYAANHQSATMPVTLTEFRSGGNAQSRFSIVVLNTGVDGWRLDQMAAPNVAVVAPLVPVTAPVNVNALLSHGQGHGKGKKGD